IGPGLGEDTVAGVVDGELVDKHTSIEEDARLEIVTDQSDEYLDVLRHSAAHVFAQALQRLHPEARLAIGPWTDEGFYYDIVGVDLDEDDLAEIEAEMENVLEEDLEITREVVDREEAFERYEDNEYKREILEDEAADEPEVSFYHQGEFSDLCKGPHVESTGEIGAVELLNIASAYWRGDEENEQLTRVYGTAFESEKELEAFKQRRKEAEKRDHRKIGRELDLFSVPDHSPGCVHWHPAGMQIRRVLEELVRDHNDDLGYEEVWTPELNKAELWKTSGHYQAFREEGEMFAWEQDDTEYGLKPMNCANHAKIYQSSQHSYRDLPIRFSEFGTCYRNEQSGELSGLLRVRGFTQDDGHAFIRPDQIQQEVAGTLEAIEEVLELFDLEVSFKLETKPDTAIGTDEMWEQATEALRDAIEQKGLAYDLEPGEGAFYGPKVAVDAEDALGREWTMGTVQIDFNLPRRFELTYVGEDNEEHYPVMVHRALLGTFERFVGVITEHLNGKYPVWLAPEQVRILPISDDNLGYAHRVKNELSAFRVTVEDRSWTVDRKIQQAHTQRIPYMLIVGDNEEEDGTISVRDRNKREQRDVTVEEFREHLQREAEEKPLKPSFLAD
ncbi:MAG: threonine--tRNA ligase, partial [Haloferacaceae archaeon]